MRVNVDKVLERDQKLSELDDRADALQAGASQFETSAAKLKRKYWWKNCKVPTFNQIKTVHLTKINENGNLLLLISLVQMALMIVSFFSPFEIHIKVVITIVLCDDRRKRL